MRIVKPGHDHSARERDHARIRTPIRLRARVVPDIGDAPVFDHDGARPGPMGIDRVDRAAAQDEVCGGMGARRRDGDDDERQRGGNTGTVFQRNPHNGSLSCCGGFRPAAEF